MPYPVVTTEGYSGMMGLIVDGILAGRNTAMCRLFANNFTPTPSSVWSDFVEASFPGYAALAMPSAVDDGLNAAPMDVWTFATLTFGPYAVPAGPVYGYWIDFINPLTLARQSLWSQRFDVPFAWINSGDTLPLILTPGFAQGI
jgi:hypothetical protein